MNETTENPDNNDISIHENSTVWAVSLGIIQTIKDIDDAVLWSRFWYTWTRRVAVPIDDADACGILVFSEFTRYAWHTVLEMNYQIKKLSEVI